MQKKKKIARKKIVTQVKNSDLVEEKHLQIVQAASRLFTQKGYNKTSLRDISHESGINLSYIYKYITTKDDILYLFYQYIAKKLRNLFNEASNEEFIHPAQELKFTLKVLYQGLLEMNEEALTMYTECRHLQKDSLLTVLSEENKFVASIEDLVQRGVSQGYFKTKDSFMAANIITYMLVFYPLRGWNFRDRYSYDEFVEITINFILDGLNVKKKYR